MEGVAFGEDAFSVMMGKSRRAIYSKKDEWKEDLSLRVDVAVGRDFMYGKEWPWKYLWSEVQREMSEQKVLSLGRIASSSKGHERRGEALQPTEWERGPGYNNTEKDSKTMRRAKSANTQYARQRQNNTTSFEQWHDKEFGLTWKMDDEVKTEALARCGMWR